MAVAATSDWSDLGGVFYERREIYSLPWGVDVDASRVASAPFGGPVALVRDDRKIIKNAAGQARCVRLGVAPARRAAADAPARPAAALRHGTNLQRRGRAARQVPLGPPRAAGGVRLD
jgi:hypothetical protein